MGKTKIDVLKNDSENVDTTNHELIHMSQYQDWFDAIIKDDVEKVKSVLEGVTKTERYRLLTSRFHYETVENFEHLDGKYKIISLPFHLAIVYCSPKVADMFLKLNVSPLCQNEKKQNVLHSCVVGAFYHNEREQHLCNAVLWLQHRIGQHQMKQLLFQENSDGFRPLEFAGQQGTLKLMQTFLESNGHLVRSDVIGMSVKQKFDITEYELGDRHGKSPIDMLVYMDAKKLNDPELKKILLGPLMTTWIKAKMRSNFPFLMVWILIRLFLFVLYYIIDSDVSFLKEVYGSNSSKICPELSDINIGVTNVKVISFMGIILCVSIFIVDITTLVRHYRSKRCLLKYNLDGKKKSITSCMFYTIDHTILLCLMFVLLTLFIIVIIQRIQVSYTLNYMGALFRVLIPVLYLWSLCYFLQLLPVIGTSVISLQKMIVDMVSFTFILGINTLLFAHVVETYVMSYSTVGCVEEFSNPLRTSYTILRMMFNMYDTTELQVTLPGVFYLIHILYIFTSAILLLNFLIAIMAESASKIAENEKTILRLNQLSIIMTLEHRIFWIFKRLYKVLHERNFIFEDGRVYLSSFTDRKQSLLAERGCTDHL